MFGCRKDCGGNETVRTNDYSSPSLIPAFSQREKEFEYGRSGVRLKMVVSAHGLASSLGSARSACQPNLVYCDY